MYYFSEVLNKKKSDCCMCVPISDHVGEAASAENCKHLTGSDYLRILFTMMAEFPGEYGEANVLTLSNLQAFMCYYVAQRCFSCVDAEGRGSSYRHCMCGGDM